MSTLELHQRRAWPSPRTQRLHLHCQSASWDQSALCQSRWRLNVGNKLDGANQGIAPLGWHLIWQGHFYALCIRRSPYSIQKFFEGVTGHIQQICLTHSIEHGQETSWEDRLPIEMNTSCGISPDTCVDKLRQECKQALQKQVNYLMKCFKAPSTHWLDCYPQHE